MKNKINNFYQIIKDSLFKYLIYLIVICLLAHLNEDIKNFFVYLKDNNPYFSAACLITLLLIIAIPYMRTKYKEYILKTYLETICFFVFTMVFFVLLKEKFSFMLMSFIFIIFITPKIEIIKNYLLKNKNKDKLDIQKIIIDSDKPITTKDKDSLGRENFVKALKNILLKNQEF